MKNNMKTKGLNNKGWHNESMRHSLAAKGVKSKSSFRPKEEYGGDPKLLEIAKNKWHKPWNELSDQQRDIARNIFIEYESKNRPKIGNDPDKQVSHQLIPLKGSRRIGSIENVDSKNADKVRDTLSKRGYKTKTVGKDIVYFKDDSPEVVEGIKLYSKYVEGKYMPSSLSPDEHYKLGEFFGISKKERKWFKQEMKEELL